MPKLRWEGRVSLGVAGACALIIVADAAAAQVTSRGALEFGPTYDSCRMFLGASDAGSIGLVITMAGDAQEIVVDHDVSGDTAVRNWIKGSMEGRRPLKEVRLSCSNHGKLALTYSLHNAFVSKIEIRTDPGQRQTERLTIKYESYKFMVAKA